MFERVQRVIVQRSVGEPGTAVDVELAPTPEPKEGELLVELVMAPINPAEILMIHGSYGYRETVPPIPRRAGIEGVGRVVGGATDRVPVGSLVSLAGAPGVFSDYTVVPADRALVIPPDVEVEAFALGFVNAQAVLLMFHEWTELSAGDWVVQNAGNSGYGRVLDAVGARRGFGVVNVVRTESAAEAIRETARGPIVVDHGDLEAAVLAATGGERPRVAVDAVGGDAAGRLAAALSSGGRLVNYGLMSGDDIRVDTRLVLFHGVRIEGFWMPRAMANADHAVLSGLAHEALDVVRDASLRIPIERSYPLTNAKEAMAHAAEGGRRGKIVLTR